MNKLIPVEFRNPYDRLNFLAQQLSKAEYSTLHTNKTEFAISIKKRARLRVSP